MNVLICHVYLSDQPLQRWCFCLRIWCAANILCVYFANVLRCHQVIFYGVNMSPVKKNCVLLVNRVEQNLDYLTAACSYGLQLELNINRLTSTSKLWQKVPSQEFSNCFSTFYGLFIAFLFFPFLCCDRKPFLLLLNLSWTFVPIPFSQSITSLCVCFLFIELLTVVSHEAEKHFSLQGLMFCNSSCSLKLLHVAWLSCI